MRPLSFFAALVQAFAHASKKCLTGFPPSRWTTCRMMAPMRRFTRLTNGFSKKFDNHCHALALYFFWYNWVRSHKAHRLTPAMAAGIATSPLELSDLVALVDARETRLLSEKRQAMLEAAE